jgi:hypothetical protein
MPGLGLKWQLGKGLAIKIKFFFKDYRIKKT